MRSVAIAFVLLGSVAIAACGDDATSKSPSAATRPPPAPVKPTAPGTVTAAAPVEARTGVVEAAGPSTVMEGTHKLVDAGKTICLLASTKVDLHAHEGKRVKVTGPARATVEGGQTIVDVETIEDLP